VSGPGEVETLERRLLGPLPADEAERLLHPEFREFGGSGRVWDREGALAELADRTETVEPKELTVTAVGDHAALATYAVAGSLRSSLWVRAADGWQILFHQGTPVPG
jgi:hypothetical protein